VLHYTAGVSSKRGSATNIAKFFGGGKAGGSADFIVDDETIVQYNPDIKNRYCWAVGGSKYTTMSTTQGGKFYGKCTNMNSVSIEMCSSKTNTKSLLASDTDWYITAKTVANAVELTKYLMKVYNIPLDRVIMGMLSYF
jgi:N-acetylmuramoyl-L-alanine amidase CwlA